jgi:uncharacterized protein (TIGR03790 family)
MFAPALLLAAVLVCARSAAAQSADNVLLVINDTNAASPRIGEYYQQKRGIPAGNVVHLKAADTDVVSRAAYAAGIEAPIAAALSKGSLQDRIFYIVLTKGVPLRIAGTSGRSGTAASVDSELALLYRRLTGAQVPLDGPVANPYFRGERAGPPAPFSHAGQDIYLVTRLDGFTIADAFALVDRSLAATATGGGTIVLDERGGLANKGNEWLSAAADRLRAMHWDERVLLETTSTAATTEKPALGYFSFGSNDPALAARVPAVTFAPGGLAGMFLSTDARTLSEPPRDWKPGPAGSAYSGSNQSLTGDLVRAGATGAAGQVAEPFLDGAVRPDILFPAYVSGLNLAEAFYSAIPSLSWQTVVLGDPLCAPFRTSGVPEEDRNPPVDPDTGLPSQFSGRRLAAIEPGASLAVRKLLALSEARRAKGDDSGAIAALEKATAADSTLETALRVLGMLYDQAGRFDKARSSYELALKQNPSDIIALNNLAYDLAVRDRKPVDALPLAERAFTLSKGAGIIGDTLGWIKHLLGEDAEALPLLESAAKSAPDNVDVQLHLAAVYAAAGRLQDAAAALKTALEVDPSVERREEYQAVLKQLGGVSRGDAR